MTKASKKKSTVKSSGPKLYHYDRHGVPIEWYKQYNSSNIDKFLEFATGCSLDGTPASKMKAENKAKMYMWRALKKKDHGWKHKFSTRGPNLYVLPVNARSDVANMATNRKFYFTGTDLDGGNKVYEYVKERLIQGLGN